MKNKQLNRQFGDMSAPTSQAEVWGIVDKLWDAYDEDLNGKLDKEETKKFLNDYNAQVGKPPVTQKEFEKIFDKYDANCDGVLTKMEMFKFV